ncbi:MAG: alpha/beta fold hydrolase [Patescibacteria group bacterium]
MLKKINLITSDGVKISGNFYKTDKADAPAVILLHMMPAIKDSWNNFAKKLNIAGFQCLAIDLRGHGESGGGPQGFQNFSDEDHQKSIYDTEGAVKFFIDKNIPMGKISLSGASIGANLALQFQAENPDIKASVLLSPGLNYKGIETEQMTKKLKKDQSIFLVAGGNNDEYSTETVQKLSNIIFSENKEIMIFKNSGHGTMIFREDPAIMDKIIDWLKNIYL